MQPLPPSSSMPRAGPTTRAAATCVAGVPVGHALPQAPHLPLRAELHRPPLQVRVAAPAEEQELGLRGPRGALPRLTGGGRRTSACAAQSWAAAAPCAGGGGGGGGRGRRGPLRNPPPPPPTPSLPAQLERIWLDVRAPERLHSDSGAEFRGAVKDLCEAFGVRRVAGGPYRPHTQNSAKRMVRHGVGGCGQPGQRSTPQHAGAVPTRQPCRRLCRVAPSRRSCARPSPPCPPSGGPPCCWRCSGRSTTAPPARSAGGRRTRPCLALPTAAASSWRTWWTATGGWAAAPPPPAACGSCCAASHFCGTEHSVPPLPPPAATPQ